MPDTIEIRTNWDIEMPSMTDNEIQSAIEYESLWENIVRISEDLSQYNYMIVASETIKHFKQLAYICSKVQDKKILVEKPLYDKVYEKIETNNQIFTAYNLRFHPVLTKLTELLHNEDVYYANIIQDLQKV